MKITTRGRYGVRLMLDLSMQNTGEAIKLKDVAKRQDISEKYLEQIIAALNKGKFVRSIRGAQGGYVLAKKPSEITVGDVLRCIEGSLAPVETLEEGAPIEPREVTSSIMVVWKELYSAINAVVDKYTFQDLADIEKAKGLDYMI